MSDRGCTREVPLKHLHWTWLSAISVLHGPVGQLRSEIAYELFDAHARLQQPEEIAHAKARLLTGKYQDVSREVQILNIFRRQQVFYRQVEPLL